MIFCLQRAHWLYCCSLSSLQASLLQHLLKALQVVEDSSCHECLFQRGKSKVAKVQAVIILDKAGRATAVRWHCACSLFTL